MASDKVQHNPTYAPNEKKRNRIKQGSQVAKEKHAKHVWKQRFLGGMGFSARWHNKLNIPSVKVWTQSMNQREERNNLSNRNNGNDYG